MPCLNNENFGHYFIETALEALQDYTMGEKHT